MNYWLVKSEPSTYSIDRLKEEKQAVWDGVRNYAARNNLRAMKKGELVLFYHSMSETEIVGVAKVVKEAYQDPTTQEEAWSAVDLAFNKKFKNPVQLSDIKKDKKLAAMDLIRLGRLSVQSVKPDEFAHILELGS